jgi:hypothetical protein
MLASRLSSLLLLGTLVLGALAVAGPVRADTAAPDLGHVPDLAHLTVGDLKISAVTVAPGQAAVRIVSPQSNA